MTSSVYHPVIVTSVIINTSRIRRTKTEMQKVYILAFIMTCRHEKIRNQESQLGIEPKQDLLILINSLVPAYHNYALYKVDCIRLPDSSKAVVLLKTEFILILFQLHNNCKTNILCVLHYILQACQKYLEVLSITF